MIHANTIDQLVSFGNYALSVYRDSMASDEVKSMVTHADVENWIFSLQNNTNLQQAVTPTANEVLQNAA